MKKYKVNITKPALEDIEQLFSYIQKDAPHASKNWLTDLQRDISTLEDMPLRNPKTPENKEFPFDIHHIIFRKKFRILYTIKANQVFILYVRRCEQDYVVPDNIISLH